MKKLFLMIIRHSAIIFFSGILFIISGLGLSWSSAEEIKPASTQDQSANLISIDNEKYKIGLGDDLHIQVWKEDALSQSVTVRPDGKITLPLIDEIQAAGLTPLQLKEKVTEKLKNFVESPTVTIFVEKKPLEKKGYNVYISGQIRNPGAYNLVGEVSLIQFIAQAGGFNEWADQKKILVIRKEGDKENRIFVNYKKIISGEAPKWILKPNDVIIVND